MEYLDLETLKSLDPNVANAISSLTNLMYHERRVTKLTTEFLLSLILELYKSPDLAPTLDSFTKKYKEDLDILRKGYDEVKLRRKKWENRDENLQENMPT